MRMIVNENFQYRGFRRAGTVLTVASMILKDEIKKGKYPNKKDGRHPWISGLLEHCSPVDTATKEFLAKVLKGEETKAEEDSFVQEADDAKEIRKIWAEFDSMGKAYDRRWGVERLRNELKKAQIFAGQEKDEKTKTETLTE